MGEADRENSSNSSPEVKYAISVERDKNTAPEAKRGFFFSLIFFSIIAKSGYKVFLF